MPRRAAGCSSGPRFFLDSCTYRITKPAQPAPGPEEHLVSLSTKTTMRDRSSRSASPRIRPHTQRTFISNFRLQAASDEELARCGDFDILRTFPGRRSEHFVSGIYDDASRSPEGASISGRSCAFSFGRSPDALDLPDLTFAAAGLTGLAGFPIEFCGFAAGAGVWRVFRR